VTGKQESPASPLTGGEHLFQGGYGFVFGVTGVGATISRAPSNLRDSPGMLNQLSRDIKNRLGALLGEADKLRQALTALGSRDGSPERPGADRSSAARTSSSRRAAATGTPAAASRQRSRARAQNQAEASSSRQRKPPAGTSAGQAGKATRSAPGATKGAILETLSTGEAMTAGEIAAATGLGRATVSTTLSRLAKTGDLNKVARGYQAPKTSEPSTSS